ncbi:MAG: hypothetical protein Fur0022_01760 [Anaerolineales bacterium]
MTKKLLFLNGLAILMIPLQHAAAYGLQAMFEWTDRYLPVEVPNYDLLGTVPYYVLTFIRQLSTFSVPSFLLISGFFVAFLATGKEGKVTWEMVMPRVRVLLYPFVIWTIIRYALLRRWPISFDEVLNPYAFVPLLIQFYLLSPFLVSIAKTRWKLLLGTVAILHLGIQSIDYLQAMGVTFPGQAFLIQVTPRWFILGQQPFWFPFGVVLGLHFRNLAAYLSQIKWKLLIATVVFLLLTIVEYQIADYRNGEMWIGAGFNGFARNFYILLVILLILALDETKLPFSKSIANLGAKSMGIYMANIPAIYLAAVLMYHATPWLLGIQVIYFIILFIVGLGGPLLLMWLVRQSPLRVNYRYLFG